MPDSFFLMSQGKNVSFSLHRVSGFLHRVSDGTAKRTPFTAFASPSSVKKLTVRPSISSTFGFIPALPYFDAYGSAASRSPSPTKLKHNTANTSISTGESSHG